MKPTNRIATLVAIPALFFTSCVTTQNPAVTMALEQVAAKVLIDHLAPAQQQEVRKYAASLAVLVRSLDPAHPATVEQFQALVNQWLPTDAGVYEPLITLVVSSYVSNISAKVSATGTVTPQQIERLAQALDAFAK